MIITQKASELEESIRRRLIKDPLASKIQEEKDKLVAHTGEISRIKSEIEAYKKSIDTYTKNIIEREGLRKYSETLIDRYVKSESINPDMVKLDETINEESFVNFFKAIGCRFVSLSFNDGSEAFIMYLRPASMISKTIVIPPTIVTLTYGNNNNLYTLNGATVTPCAYPCPVGINGDHYFHPHVRAAGSSRLKPEVCLGNLWDKILSANVALTISGYEDHAILINTLLSTYNPESPFYDLVELTTDYLQLPMKRFESRISIANGGTAMISPELKTTSRLQIPVFSLFPPSMIDDYNEMVKQPFNPDIMLDHVFSEMKYYSNNYSDHDIKDVIKSMDKLLFKSETVGINSTLIKTWLDTEGIGETISDIEIFYDYEDGNYDCISSLFTFVKSIYVKSVKGETSGLITKVREEISQHTQSKI